MAAADPDEAAWLLAELPGGPESLLARLSPYLSRDAPRILPEGEDDRSAACRSLAELHRELADAWSGGRESVSALLQANPSLSQTSYKPAQVAEALAGMDAWCAGPPTGEPPARLALFTPEKLSASTKKGGAPPSTRSSTSVPGLRPSTSRGWSATRRAGLLADAYRFLREELYRRKTERRVVFYDDLLSRTAAALDGPRGPGPGRAGAHRTSPGIDRRVPGHRRPPVPYLPAYLCAMHCGKPTGGRRRRSGSILIGDPKQAIYGFRGADIFAYIAARRQAQIQGRIHTLDTNRRSASATGAAVNRVFGGARAPFVFEPDIRFEPVQPGSGLGPGAAADRRCACRAAPLSLATLAADNATRSGNRIVTECRPRPGGRGLRPPDRGPAGRVGADRRPVAQGRRYRGAGAHPSRRGPGPGRRWAHCGIGCVSIGQDTVFDSEEAEDLDALLAALAPGAGGDRLRAALATRLLGWTAGELAGLVADEGAWDSVLARFEGYRETWRTRGFMAALDGLIHGEGVPERLRRGPDGERRLTNLMHLAELAQAASREQGGERRGPRV